MKKILVSGPTKAPTKKMSKAGWDPQKQKIDATKEDTEGSNDDWGIPQWIALVIVYFPSAAVLMMIFGNDSAWPWIIAVIPGIAATLRAEAVIAIAFPCLMLAFLGLVTINWLYGRVSYTY